MNNKKLGYVRISTKKQSAERQERQLEEYGIEKTYSDTGTGSNTERNELQLLLEKIETGEVEEVVAVSVTRISRSMTDLFRLIEEHFEPTDTKLTLLNDPLDYDPQAGKMAEIMFKMLSMMSEMEREMTRERVRRGVHNAIEKGKHVGRPPTGFTVVDDGEDKGSLIPDENYDTVAQTLSLVDDGEVSKRQAAKRIDASRATINRILQDEERREMYNL